jgi:hypothetical protein
MTTSTHLHRSTAYVKAITERGGTWKPDPITNQFRFIVDFGILKWPSSAIYFGPPRERTGTLIRAKPEAEEFVGLESESGVVRTDPSRV